MSCQSEARTAHTCRVADGTIVQKDEHVRLARRTRGESFVVATPRIISVSVVIRPLCRWGRQILIANLGNGLAILYNGCIYGITYNFKSAICTWITMACRVAAGFLPFAAEFSRIEWSLGAKRRIELL